MYQRMTDDELIDALVAAGNGHTAPAILAEIERRGICAQCGKRGCDFACVSENENFGF